MNRNAVAKLARSAAAAGLSALLLSGCGLLGRNVDTGPTPEAARGGVRTAYAQMGKNYRSGGASPQKGFDCSDLIWWVYNKNGVKVPRITVDQARVGQPVPREQVRPGDIVVFRTGSSPRGLHTGIYAGGNSFIHSPRQGEKVRMENLDIPYWRSRLISVRRVVR
jgi:cell wall-associated NlpC family hydrolase